MPQNANTATPDIYDDIRGEYRDEYLKKVRGNKSMSRREALGVAGFGLCLFGMLAVSMLPVTAMATVGVIVLGAGSFASLIDGLRESGRIENKARALIQQDIENGTLLSRYEEKLTTATNQQITALKDAMVTKLGALRTLKAMFTAAATAEPQTGEQSPAPKATAEQGAAAPKQTR